MQTTEPMEELKRRFNAKAAQNITANYLLRISGTEGGPWLTKISMGNLEVETFEQGRSPAPDCTISVSKDDLQLIMEGKLSAMTAALSGVLVIDGDLGLATQLVPIFFEGQAF